MCSPCKVRSASDRPARALKLARYLPTQSVAHALTQCSPHACTRVHPRRSEERGVGREAFSLGTHKKNRVCFHLLRVHLEHQPLLSRAPGARSVEERDRISPPKTKSRDVALVNMTLLHLYEIT